MNHFMMNRVAAAALLFGLLVAATVRCDDGWPDIEVEEWRASAIDEQALAAARASGAAKTIERLAKMGPLNVIGHDKLNKDQVHPLSHPDEYASTLLQGFRSLARQSTPKSLSLSSKSRDQAWSTDPLNNSFFFRFVTWWHIFGVGSLTKYEVIARIFQQLERTKAHFANNGGPVFFEFVFGGASFYPGGPGGRFSCNNPDTYRAAIAAAKSPSRYLNTVICGRDDGLLGEASFPYDINGQAYPLLEEDPRHMIQIDPEALPGGAYGSDTASGNSNSDLAFNGPTWSHLLGHFFGLAHVFQDDEQCPAGGPAFDNDGLSDTYTQQLPYAAVDCSNTKRDCGDPNAYDLSNLMGFALCASRFSPLQKSRMRDIIVEFRPLLASRQDCEANPCFDKSLDCSSGKAVAFAISGENTDEISIGTVNAPALSTSILFSVLQEYNQLCVPATASSSAACISAASRWCAQNTDTYAAYIGKVNGTTSLDISCLEANYHGTNLLPSACTPSSINPNALYSVECRTSLTDLCDGDAGFPAEIQNGSLLYICVFVNTNDVLPLAAIKRYDAYCNADVRLAEPRCREAVLRYGQNSAVCSCTRGYEPSENCYERGTWSVSGWGQCLDGCVQTRTTTCNFGTCDDAREPATSRKCAFGLCEVSLNSECLGAVDLPKDTKFLAEERLRPRFDGVTPVVGDPDFGPIFWNDSACASSRVAVWYRFRFDFSVNAVFTVKAATSAMYLSLHSGSCAALTLDGCTATSLPSLTSNALLANVDFFVRVMSVTNATATFDFEYTFTRAGPQLADTCATATVLPFNATMDLYTLTDRMLLATPSVAGSLPPAGVCGRSASSPDLWYTFTPPRSGAVFFVGSVNAQFDVVFTLFKGTCAGLDTIICADDSDIKRTPSTVFAMVTAGTQYWLRVASYNGIVPLMNQDQFYVDLSFFRAQTYTFTELGFDPCNPLTCLQTQQVRCNATQGGNSIDTYCLTSTVSKPATSRVCCTDKLPEPNSCGTPEPLNSTVGIASSIRGNLSDDKLPSLNTTVDFMAGACNNSRSYRDYWYTFTAGANVKFSASIASRAWVISLFSGSCSQTTLVVCANDATIANQQLYEGVTYYVRVARPPTDTDPIFTLAYSFAQDIDNDFCDLAPTVVVNATMLSGVVNGSFSTATPSTGYGLNAADVALNPVCASSIDSNDVWYRFSVAEPLRGMLQMSIDYTVLNQPFKGVVSVHSDCETPASACASYTDVDPSPTEVAVNPTRIGTGRVSLSANSGVWMVRVATFDSTAPNAAAFQLKWWYTRSEPKAWRQVCSLSQVEHRHLTYGNNQDILLSISELSEVTKFATSNGPICGSSALSRSTWMQVTSEMKGLLTVSILASEFDTVVSLHPSLGDCARSVTETLACDDDSGGFFRSKVSLHIGAYQTYLVRISGNLNATGTFQVRTVINDAYPKDDAFWRRGPWSRCSDRCEQTRSIVCVNKVDRPVSSKLCKQAQPEDYRQCRGQECRVFWVSGSWSECNDQCFQTRGIACQSGVQSTFLDAKKCPKSLEPHTKRVCIGGKCALVSDADDPVLELKLSYRYPIAVSPQAALTNIIADVFCPHLLVDLPEYASNQGQCNSQTVAVSNMQMQTGRAFVRFGGQYAREGLTSVLDLMNNGRSSSNYDDVSWFLRYFEKPSVTDFPSAATVFGPKSSSNRDRNIALGVGIGLGGFLLLVLIALGVAFYLKKRHGRGAGAVASTNSFTPGPSYGNGGGATEMA